MTGPGPRRGRGRGSIRRRMTLAVGAVTAALLIGFAALVYSTFERALYRQLDEGLVARAHALAGTLEREARGWELELADDMAPEYAAVAEPDAYYQMWLPTGEVLRSRSLRGSGNLRRRAGSWSEPVLTSETLPDGRPGRACGIRFEPRIDDEIPPVQAEAMRGEVVLVMAADASSAEAALADVRRWLLGAGLAVVAAAALIAAFVVSRGLRPLSGLGLRIARIDERSLSERLDTADLPSELVPPVTKLNELLAGLDDAFARERRFTADVSHELRTPLAGLSVLLQVAGSKQRSEAEYRETITEALVIAEQMTGLVENLLLLARLEAGRAQPRATTFSLRELVDDCFAPCADQAATRGLSFDNEVPDMLEVCADRDLLGIALRNALANAAAYTEEGGWIRASQGDGGTLDVADSGPPLSEADLARVFDRMWRADSARSETGVHAGIGLALARAVCEALGGRLGAESTPDGHLVFRFTLPSSSPGTTAAS